MSNINRCCNCEYFDRKDELKFVDSAFENGKVTTVVHVDYCNGAWKENFITGQKTQAKCEDIRVGSHCSVFKDKTIPLEEVLKNKDKQIVIMKEMIERRDFSIEHRSSEIKKLGKELTIKSAEKEYWEHVGRTKKRKSSWTGCHWSELALVAALSVLILVLALS